MYFKHGTPSNSVVKRKVSCDDGYHFGLLEKTRLSPQIWNTEQNVD